MIPIKARYKLDPNSTSERVTIVNMLIDTQGDIAIFFIHKDGRLDVAGATDSFTECEVAPLPTNV